MPHWAWLVASAGVLELTLLIALRGNSYWSFSDGVYSASAREFLHGLTPYRDFTAAQPPPVFLVGAALLAVSDTPSALHIGLGLVDLMTAGLVGLCVWRLERRPWLVLIAVLIAPLLPISLNGHAQLVPETLAAPLVLGGAILCARADRQFWGVVLLVLAVWCKLAFVLPAAAILLVTPRRWRSTATFAGASVVLWGGSIAVFGTGVWRETVIAQFQVGDATLHYAAGLVAQAVWNELPLVIGAVTVLGLVWRDRGRFGDRALVRTLGAAASGGVLLVLTVVKNGSYINVMAVAEPPLFVLAISGAAWAWRGPARRRTVAVVLSALLLAQSGSLLLHPADPWVAVRPFAHSGLEWSASQGAVARDVAAARRCPGQVAYSGNPYIAFLAHRRMPGNQPDLFMLANAPEDHSFAEQAAHDTPTCP